jgi:hypothetical protein
MTSHNIPTIFHVTHWKAGSQWIHKILRACVPDIIVDPQIYVAHFLSSPIQKGKVYPTVYVTRKQFYSVHLPPNWRHFVIIRDLRDTLISAYFSLKTSHSVVAPSILEMRQKLHTLSIEDGLLYLLDEWLSGCADIQKSWLEYNEKFIYYEDLLLNDIEILEKILIDDCNLPVSKKVLNEAITANRFEMITKGRKRGQENITAHERKGIAGDWHNYFTDKVKDRFKCLYGKLLVATGYEQDMDW